MWNANSSSTSTSNRPLEQAGQVLSQTIPTPARINTPIISSHASLFNHLFFSPAHPYPTLVSLLRATCQVVQSLQVVGASEPMPLRAN